MTVMEQGLGSGQFPLRRITARSIQGEDGTVRTTFEGAGPWYSKQSTTTTRTGTVTTQLGGEIFGTGQQTVSRILIECFDGYKAIVEIPSIGDNGHPSLMGRAVTEHDLEHIAQTLDLGMPIALNLYDKFRKLLAAKLQVSPPSEDDLYAWCFIIRMASENGVLDAVFRELRDGLKRQ